VRFSFTDGERDIYKLSPQELSAIRWSHLSYIMQGSMSVLNPVRRIKHSFVDFALPHVNVKGADFTNLVERHLKRVHLEPAVLQAYPHELSGGMRQRVTIALATVCGPEFIIADEPTTALDVIVQKGVLLMLREIQQELKSSILFVTHDMAVHANLTDRLGIMYAGRLVEEGRTRDMFKKPLHPYTAHLISSLPRIGDEAPKKGLEGSPPSLADPPAGCRFHPRCPLAIDICRREAPPMVEILPGHRAACHVAQADPTRVETVA
jgi:peptide/nickel transport system ATP-binding protein